MPHVSVTALAASLLLSAALATGAAALDMKPSISLELAKRMADACEAKAKQEGWKLSIAVVDPGADLVLFRRMPNAHLGSVDIAQGKARTAARMPFPTRRLAEIVYGEDGKGGRVPGLAHIEGFTAFTGGLPIKAGDTLVGGIGISGATGDQDEECADAALAAIADDLK